MSRIKIRFGKVDLADIRVYIVDPVDASVVDISQGGMAIHTIVPLHIGHQYRLEVSGAGSSVSLDGEVVRCKVKELSEDLDGTHFPLYLNGIRFMIQRNPIEISLLEIMHANVGSERRQSPRMKPLEPLSVKIAHPFACRLVELSGEGVTVSSTEIPDIDDELDLLLQVGYETLLLHTRLLHVSKRDGEDAYHTRLELVRLEARNQELLSALLEAVADHA